MAAGSVKRIIQLVIGKGKRFWNHLGEYYDKIIADFRGATAIQIFGPEVAKYEPEKRLENAGLSESIVSTENAKKNDGAQDF